MIFGTIELNEEVFDIRIGGQVVGRFCKRIGIPLSAYNDSVVDDYENMMLLTLMSIAYAHRRGGKDFRFKDDFQAFCDFVDDDPRGLQKCADAFMESQIGDQVEADLQSDEEGSADEDVEKTKEEGGES